MSENKVIKSVSFNKTKEDDATILKAVNRRNFSGYVKKLILADIKAREMVATFKEPAEQPETAAEKMARLKEQLKKPSK